MLTHLLLTLFQPATTGPLVAAEFGAVAVDFHTVTHVWEAATGGDGPYTYVIYRSTTEGFTPGPGNVVAQGIDALTYTDSSGLSQGVVYHYRLGTIDAADTEALGSAEVYTGLAWDGTLTVGGGGGIGSGDTAIDHDGAAGVTVNGAAAEVDCMRFTVGGIGADGVEIVAFLKADYAAGRRGPDARRGTTETGTDGRWVAPLMLDAGTYTLLAHKDGFLVAEAEVLIP